MGEETLGEKRKWQICNGNLELASTELTGVCVWGDGSGWLGLGGPEQHFLKCGKARRDGVGGRQEAIEPL